MSGKNGGGNGAHGNGAQGAKGNGPDDWLDGFDRTSYVGGEPLRADPSPHVFASCRPQAYPIEVWEVAPIAQAAVQEEAAYNGQPFEMITTSFLGGAGAFCQHIADVDRESGGVVGPISLFSLVIADSGERKTTIDKNLIRGPIEEALSVLAAREKPALARMGSAIKHWEREKADLERLLTKLRTANKKGVADQADIDATQQKLTALEENEPPQPRPPRFIFDDATPEAIKHSLIAGYPVGALIANEGGLVIGGRAMTEDNCLNFMTLLNVLFDGQQLTIARRAGGYLSASGRRFSANLAMQWSVFEEFLQAAGGKARGAGLLSRFLIAAPAPVAHQHRASRTPLPARLAQDALRKLIIDCMLAPLPSSGPDLALQPPTVPLGEGRWLWCDYYDWCHAEMAPGRGFAEVTDIAARSPEIAARIAVVLHILLNGPSEALRAMAGATVEAAIAIARWHLFEARRVLAEDDHRQCAEDAKEVLRCLLTRGPALSRKEISQFVTCRALRKNAKRRNKAIDWLLAQGLIVQIDRPNVVLVPHPGAELLLSAADNPK